ncbi:MAG: 50S ribosomal protein L10 [bacterium]|nr:50S ribosomal protein L10 [bacterium]MXZ31006.1 50S ribosomal protein L10 [Acidimicrobiia bacterium]MYJ13200.1 50S ribosomal protein L10 [Acidimicrobiia bacterium]
METPVSQPNPEDARTPRPDKVAAVAEIRARLAAAQGALLTDYRGLDTAALAALRHSLAPHGGSYKVYKNTLIRLAARELGIDCEHLLVGPTAVAFVEARADGRPGDAAAVAKALYEFQRTDKRLVVKGGLLGTDTVGPEAVESLSKLPPAEQLQAQLAGALASPLQKTATLLAAPLQEFAGLAAAPARSFAGLLRALIDQRSPA